MSVFFFLQLPCDFCGYTATREIDLCIYHYQRNRLLIFAYNLATRLQSVKQQNLILEWALLVFISLCIQTIFIIFFQAEDGIRDRSPSRGLGDVYKRQLCRCFFFFSFHAISVGTPLPEKSICVFTTTREIDC